MRWRRTPTPRSNASWRATFPTTLKPIYDIKDPVLDTIMAVAFEWAERTGWQHPPTDA